MDDLKSELKSSRRGSLSGGGMGFHGTVEHVAEDEDGLEADDGWLALDYETELPAAADDDDDAEVVVKKKSKRARR